MDELDVSGDSQDIEGDGSEHSDDLQNEDDDEDGEMERPTGLPTHTGSRKNAGPLTPEELAEFEARQERRYIPIRQNRRPLPVPFNRQPYARGHIHT